MASTVKHLRSSTANKRPTASGLADGQLAINTASGTPGLFLKDNAGAVVKVGPVHVGAAAPNATPAGSSGNSKGELWVNDTTTIHGLNYFSGSAFVNLTPSGTTTAAGLVELATNAETQTGTDTIRAVTPSGLQSKVSDSTSTTSSTTIASSTAVKAAFDLANAALPKSGGRVTGNLEIGPTGSLSFEGSTDDNFETFLEVVNPTADRTITFPNVTGTVVTTGDTGTVTSAMITDGTIVNADINASAGIVDTKLATISTAGKVSNSATTAVSANTVNAIVTRDGSGNFSAGTITANLTGTASAIADNTVTSAKIVDGAIVNVDVNASAAIAGTKIAPNFGSQNVVTTGTNTAASLIPTGSTVPTNGVYLPAANTVGVATNGGERLRITSAGLVGIGVSSPQLPLTIGLGGGANPATSGSTQSSGGIARIGSFGVATLDIGILAAGATWLQATNVTNLATNYNLLLNPNGGNVGIGTTSPNELLEVAGNIHLSGADRSIFNRSNNALTFGTNNTERARIDSSGRLLVGTSSAPVVTSATAPLNVALGNEHAATFIRYSANQFGPFLAIGKSRSDTKGGQTAVIANDSLGVISFIGSNGSDFSNQAGSIEGYVDGTPGANNMPGRLVFSTTADGASSPTERMRITNGGYLKASNTGSYNNPTGSYHEFRQSVADNAAIFSTTSNASYASDQVVISCARAENTAYSFLVAFSSTTADTEFRLRGDGNAFADGAWTGGGADYAEYFEWSDENLDAEDRRGISVVLDGDKIRPAEAGEDPIGVISGNPSVVGDAAWNKWSGKCLRDEYGTYIQEDYEVEDEDGNTVIQQRRKLNPAYDPDMEYVSREQRPEWDCVGLMGKLRIRKGQVTGSRWIKMRDISATVEEWLVR
jgi:hypothetical protein